MSKFYTLRNSILLSTLATAISACSGQGVVMNATDGKVFPQDSSTTSQGNPDTGSTGNTGGGSSGSGGSCAGGIDIILPVTFLCSSDRSSKAGTNLYQSESLTITVLDHNQKTVCTVVDGRANILAKKTIDLSSCTLDMTQTYLLTAANPTLPANNLLASSATNNDTAAQEIKYGKNGWVGVNKIEILYDTNPKVAGGVNDGNKSGQCDNDASPLIISVAATSQMPPLKLTPPSHGVWFDILGENALPIMNAPQMISWFTNTNFGFLALPTSAGQIKGIDQLFGNNTMGPDGKFSDDGFAALAKYDANGDGKIDAQDPIFSKLVVWVDANYDGVAQASEMRSLSDLGITEIQLNYNAGFTETDKYGNRIVDKSVAVDQDGSSHLVFDLWFNLKANY